MSAAGDRAVTAALDHIVIAGPDLGALVDWVAERTGVVAQPGGRHPTGTQNALIALTVEGKRGPQYLELIGPWSDAGDAPLPTAFDINRLAGPTVQTFAVRPSDIDGAIAAARSVGWEIGPVRALSRSTPEGELLEWRLTRIESGEQARFDVPFLIDWGETTQPGETVVPTLELLEFARLESTEERAELIRRELASVGAEGVAVRVAERPGFALTVRTESGETVEFLP